MANLSPYQFDLTRLAVGVLYINLGRAAPSFPTTTKSHPSYRVHVALIPPTSMTLDTEFGGLFPFEVHWDLWQRVIVPLFAEGSALVKLFSEQSSSLRNLMNQVNLTADLTALLDTIRMELLQRLEALGFVPSSNLSSEPVIVDPPVPGAPVLRLGTVELEYEQFDVR